MSGALAFWAPRGMSRLVATVAADCPGIAGRAFVRSAIGDADRGSRRAKSAQAFFLHAARSRLHAFDHAARSLLFILGRPSSWATGLPVPLRQLLRLLPLCAFPPFDLLPAMPGLLVLRNKTRPKDARNEKIRRKFGRTGRSLHFCGATSVPLSATCTPSTLASAQTLSNQDHLTSSVILLVQFSCPFRLSI
jgi:hypothetical protein